MALPQSQPPVSDDDPRRQHYQAYIETVNRHDFVAMKEFYTPAVMVNDEPRDSAEVAGQFVPLIEAFPDWHWHVRRVGVDGDYLHVHLRLTGTQTGVYMGIQPTGRRVEQNEFAIYHLVDGKFAEVWVLTDMDGLAEKLT